MTSHPDLLIIPGYGKMCMLYTTMCATIPSPDHRTKNKSQSGTYQAPVRSQPTVKKNQPTEFKAELQGNLKLPQQRGPHHMAGVKKG